MLNSIEAIKENNYRKPNGSALVPWRLSGSSIYNSQGLNFRCFRGFSLMEVMVVLVIIGLLAGVIGISVQSYVDRGRTKKATADIAVLHAQVKAFYADHGQYPSMTDGLAVLQPDYVERLSKDPWSREYQYEIPGRDGPFDIICLGRDGQEGGDGADADLTNWMIIEESGT